MKFLFPSQTFSSRIYLLGLLVGLLFLFLNHSLAASSFSSLSEITISADEMNRDGEKQLVELTGNVQLIFKDNYLAADRAIIYPQTKTIQAEGHVIFQTPSAYAEAESLRFNYETNKGTMTKAFIQSGQVVFEGDEIEKISEKDYIAINGHYTACTTCPPSWSFSGQRIEAELGGYADIKYPIFRIGGYGIFILPRLVIPLKSTRQSGLLPPSWDYSGSGGLAISQSYFWALSRSQDVTLSAKHYQKRGWKGLFDYRFVLTEESRGEFKGAAINDRGFKESERDKSQTLNRGFAHYSHYFHMPNNYIHRADLNHISDLRYVRDFPDEIKGHGDPALENRISVTRNRPKSHISAEAAFYVNLLQENSSTGNEDAVNRFPEIRYSLLDQRVLNTNLMFRFDVDYVNFVRNTLAYDDLNSDKEVPLKRDGTFDPSNDIIRTGHRLNMTPTLSYPLQIYRVIDILPSLSYRETFYRFNPTAEPNSPTNYERKARRRYVKSDISATTKFSRVFSASESPKANRLKHEIQPELTYSTIPWVERPEHPFFGQFEDQPYSRSQVPIADKDIVDSVNKMQFDYNDRLFNKNLVGAALTNRVIRKRWFGGNPDYKNIASFRVSQYYDLDEAKRQSPQPWSPINGLLTLKFDHFETNTTAIYYPYAPITNMSSRVRVFSDIGSFAEVSYSRFFIVDEDNNFKKEDRTENISWGAGWNTRYFNLHGQIDYSNVTYKIYSWQYSTVISPPGECWQIRFRHQQVVGGDTILDFNFDFQFGDHTNPKS